MNHYSVIDKAPQLREGVITTFKTDTTPTSTLPPYWTPYTHELLTSNLQTPFDTYDTTQSR